MVETLQSVRIWIGDIPSEVADELASAPGGLAVDIETTGLNWEADKVATIQMATAAGAVYLVRVTERRPLRVLSLLENTRVVKVLHHAMFDLRFFAAKWECRAANVRCTKIASKLLRPQDPGPTHSLKPLLLRHLGIEIGKQQQLSDWLVPQLTQDQLIYAANDVLHLHALLAALMCELDARGLSSAAAECFRHLPTRVFLEVGGYPDVFAY